MFKPFHGLDLEMSVDISHGEILFLEFVVIQGFLNFFESDLWIFRVKEWKGNNWLIVKAIAS